MRGAWGTFCAICAAAKPVLWTVELPRPLLRPSPRPGVAIPSPKSALATVALSRADGHVKRPRGGSDQLAVGLAVIARLQTVRVAKTAGLHLFDRRIDGGRY